MASVSGGALGGSEVAANAQCSASIVGSSVHGACRSRIEKGLIGVWTLALPGVCLCDARDDGHPSALWLWGARTYM